MKTKLIVGSLLAVFLMMMAPSIPAMEYQTMEKANEEYYVDYIQKMDEEEFKDFILNLDISDKELLEIIKDKIKNPTCCKILCRLIKILIKLLLLPIKLMLLPFKIICKIIRLPFKIIRCIIQIILPGKHHHKHICC